MAQIPKLSPGKITHVLKLPEFWAVGSAIILAPLLAPYVSQLISRVPFFNAHPTAALIIFGLIVLLIASTMGGGIFRAIVLGAGASMVILAALPTIRSFASR